MLLLLFFFLRFHLVRSRAYCVVCRMFAHSHAKTSQINQPSIAFPLKLSGLWCQHWIYVNCELKHSSSILTLCVSPFRRRGGPVQLVLHTCVRSVFTMYKLNALIPIEQYSLSFPSPSSCPCQPSAAATATTKQQSFACPRAHMSRIKWSTQMKSYNIYELKRVMRFQLIDWCIHPTANSNTSIYYYYYYFAFSFWAQRAHTFYWSLNQTKECSRYSFSVYSIAWIEYDKIVGK